MRNSLALAALLAWPAARVSSQTPPSAPCEGPGCGRAAPSDCEGPGCGKASDLPCQGPGCGKADPVKSAGPGCGRRPTEECLARAREALDQAAEGLGPLQTAISGGKTLSPEQRAALVSDLERLVENGKSVYGGSAQVQKDFMMMANASLGAAKRTAGSPSGPSGGRRLGPLLGVTLRQLSFLKAPPPPAAKTPAPVEEFLKSKDGNLLFQEVLEDGRKAKKAEKASKKKRGSKPRTPPGGARSVEPARP